MLQHVNCHHRISQGIDGHHPLTHREIAEQVGTAREVVSRTLGALEDQGVIRTERGQIEVCDPARLEALLAD